MKVDGINTSNIINSYNKNKGILIKKVQEVKTQDTIEISALGKSLTNYSLQDNKINNLENVKEIKSRIENGTYNVDAKLTAIRILDTIQESRLWLHLS